jgi:hypothetical protein
MEWGYTQYLSLQEDVTGAGVMMVLPDASSLAEKLMIELILPGFHQENVEVNLEVNVEVNVEVMMGLLVAQLQCPSSTCP